MRLGFHLHCPHRKDAFIHVQFLWVLIVHVLEAFVVSRVCIKVQRAGQTFSLFREGRRPASNFRILQRSEKKAGGSDKVQF